jgi:hypothetical protein
MMKSVRTEQLVSVVYFIYLPKDSLWKPLVSDQLKDLIDCELVHNADIHVVLSCLDPQLMNEGITFIHSMIRSAQIHVSSENNYEYSGIRQVWELGQNSSNPKNHIILYHHSKGITLQKKGMSYVRDPCNQTMANSIIKPWCSILKRFENEPNLNKAGYACAAPGWMWFNFFWVRASYLHNVVEPIKTNRRHYYEDWLGRLIAPPHGQSGTSRAGEVGIFTNNKDGLSLCPSNTEKTLGVLYNPDMTRIN